MVLESLVLKEAFAFSWCVFLAWHICHVLVSSLACLEDASISSFFSSQAETELPTHILHMLPGYQESSLFGLNLMCHIFPIYTSYQLFMKGIPLVPHFYSLSLGIPHFQPAKQCIPLCLMIFSCSSPDLVDSNLYLFSTV